MGPVVPPWDTGSIFWTRDSEASTSPPSERNGIITEAWAQGFMVGSLLILSCITMANMRRRVILHKLIFIELLLGIWHGFFIFFESPVYNWWLSVSAIFLNISWSLHNVVAWIKNKPFLSRRVSLFYIGTVILVQPYWVLEIYANFAFFHGVNEIFLKTRPFEALFRDPWWIFTTISLFYNIKKRYALSLREIVRLSPRFGIMMFAMVASICFLVVDICSVTGAFGSGLPVGINPFWKLSFVFKCLTDCVVLDDFKTALDRLHAFQVNRLHFTADEKSDHCAPRSSSYPQNGLELAAKSYGENRVSPDQSWFHHQRQSNSSDHSTSPVTRTSSEAEMSRHPSRAPRSRSPTCRRDSLEN